MRYTHGVDAVTPFVPEVWPSELQGAATALWHFHEALDAPNSSVDFANEAERCAAGAPLRVINPHIAQVAYAVSKEHNLDVDLLAAQVKATESLVGTVRFRTPLALMDFIRLRCGAHARILAQLAGVRGRFRIQGIEAFARGVFMTRMLCELSTDLARDRLYLPLAELDQYGVTLEQLRNGRVDESVRRLLWKQSVRIRDAFGTSQRFGIELEGWTRRHFKRQWMHGLYLLTAVERRKFDVWSAPVTLSAWQRTQLRWQVIFGKTTFR